MDGTYIDVEKKSGFILIEDVCYIRMLSFRNYAINLGETMNCGSLQAKMPLSFGLLGPC